MVAAEVQRSDRLLRRLYDPDDDVMVAAHRGDWRNAPENSLAAVERAIALGVDIVEIDVRRTRDGEFVLIHDETLDRTTTGSGLVREYDAAALRKLRLRNGYGVPTEHSIPFLTEFLATVHSKVLIYIDKSEQAMGDIYRSAARVNAENHVLFYGHLPREELKKRWGDVADKVHYLPKLGEATDRPMDYLKAFPQRTPAFVTSFSSPDSAIVQLFPKIKARPARVWVSPLWPEICGGRTDELGVVDPHAAWGWHIAKGASILCTDRPRELIDYLRDRGLHE